MGKILSKADILSRKGLDVKTINVPEWGGDVMYRPMSMIERREIRKKCTSTETNSSGENKVDLDAEMMEVLTVVYCVVDPSDLNKMKKLFTPDDIHVLESQMSAGGISTVAQAILKDSGLGGAAPFRGEKEPQK